MDTNTTSMFTQDTAAAILILQIYSHFNNLRHIYNVYWRAVIQFVPACSAAALCKPMRAQLKKINIPTKELKNLIKELVEINFHIKKKRVS